MIRRRQPVSQLPATIGIDTAAAIRGRGIEDQFVPARSGTSRRALLGIVASAPFACVASAELAGAVRPAIEPISLRRTREGRQLSRTRYHAAESFFAPVGAGFLGGQSDLLYQTGIVLQLALSSHLLDVGFDDAWCAQNIGLYINRSLGQANATGLGHDCTDLKGFAEFLSPYGRWRNPVHLAATEACPFSREQILRITRELLERVHEVTGHPRPRGRSQRNG
jgi:hypothetical protein